MSEGWGVNRNCISLLANGPISGGAYKRDSLYRYFTVCVWAVEGWVESKESTDKTFGLPPLFFFR